MDWLNECIKHQEQMLSDLGGLIAIPSLRDDSQRTTNAPFGRECRRALDYMLELGKREGFSVSDIDGYAGVLAYGEGQESIGVLAHLDVVPQGSGWSKEPFTLSEENGVLFGRGVMDDKGPGIAAFYALKMLKDAHIKLAKKVMLIYGCDEESGMECMDYYVKHAEVPQMGFVPDADFPLIYGEKGGLHVELSGQCSSVIKKMHAGERANIVIAQASAEVNDWDEEKERLFHFYLKAHALRGSVVKENRAATVTIIGKSAHAAVPYEGINAALELLNFIGSAYDDVFAKQTYTLLHDWLGSGIHNLIEGAYMGFLTLNVGFVDIEAEKAKILLDIRYPNDTDADAIMQRIKEALSAVAYPLQPLLKKQVNPLFVDPSSKLVTTLDVYRSCSHDHFYPAVTIGGGTYAKKLANFVAYGPQFPSHDQHAPCFIGGAHQRDEGILLADLQKATAIYAEAIHRLAGQE